MSAGAEPRSSLGLPNFFGASLISLAENWFRGATREQLEALARRVSAVDRDRAIEAAALLMWSASGADPELARLSSSLVRQLSGARWDEFSPFAERLVKLDPPKARALWIALGTELGAYDQAFREWMKERAE